MIETRRGFRHFYTLQEGEDYAFYNNVGVVIVHPERPAFIIDWNGNRIEFIPKEAS